MIVRPFHAGDIAECHRINQANVPAVGSVVRQQLVRLIDLSHLTLVVETDGIVAGFLLCLIEDTDHDGLNYRWFCERHEQFAYVDRIALAAEFQGRRGGQLLYDALEQKLSGRHAILACEVNAIPPNPGSLRFHKRLGFSEAGRREFDAGAKAVIYLEKSLTI